MVNYKVLQSLYKNIWRQDTVTDQSELSIMGLKNVADCYLFIVCLWRYKHMSVG